ncbi:UNVERIFIED_CONTAM: hypothetical protein Sradi_3508000 [Sesamum radiatum]|uniref:Uncharacterized protein n=1 Tax=Sesamum radiatum TaxID=300843 RepID=A0AAW2QE89_SESRA
MVRNVLYVRPEQIQRHDPRDILRSWAPENGHSSPGQFSGSSGSILQHLFSGGKMGRKSRRVCLPSPASPLQVVAFFEISHSSFAK